MLTEEQFDQEFTNCKEIYAKKLKDYGAAWRIMRPSSLTDQIFIKAERIRSLETKGDAKVHEGIRPELIGIVNYGIIALIQLELGYADTCDLNTDEAIKAYEKHTIEVRNLMMCKNHDYDEAWRKMRKTSYTDLILMKLYRTKQIENNENKTLISEGVDANYMDIINYAIFGLIKIDFGE